MTTFDVVQNNTGSTVAAPYTPGSGTLQLADASAFPTSYPYRLSLFAPDGSPKSILAVTGRVGNVLAVGSALEGTADVSLSVGDLARLRVTAGALQDVHTAINGLEGAVATYGDVVTHNAAEFGSATTLSNHVANTSNPHSTTAVQVGAYTTSQVDTLLAGKQAAGSYVPETRTVAGHALSTNVTVTASDVGLGSVTNDAQLKASQLVTSVGTPGVNTNVPSEKAVRDAIGAAGGGTVSSVGLTMPTGFSVANSPVTGSATLAVTTALSGYVKASAGAFTAGSIAAGDIPDISSTYATVSSLSGYVPTSRTVAGHALTGNVTITAADVSAVPTTRTVAGHALSADVTVSASDVGAAPAAGSSSIVTVGTIGTGTWQGSVIGPAYLGTGSRDGTKYLRDDGAWTAVSGGGSSYDMLSPLTAAEISVTGATTLTIDRAHVCSGSSNYTVNLPAVTGNTGKSLLVRVAMTSTALVTIDAGSGVTIDGTQTVILWAGEDIIFRCDGTNWNMGPGRRRAFICTMRLNGGGSPFTAQAIAADTVVKILLNATDSDPSGQMADTANNQIVIRRPGTYMVIGLGVYNGLSAATNRAIMNVYKNGSAMFASETYGGATSNPTATATKVVTLAAGDALTLIAYLVGVTSYAYGDPTGTACYLTVAEIFS